MWLEWGCCLYTHHTLGVTVLYHCVPRHQTENMPGTIYKYKALTLDGKEEKLWSAYKGSVVLMVNFASLWGTTVRDCTQMNQLAEQYGESLVILAFPCNQFGHQVSWLPAAFKYLQTKYYIVEIEVSKKWHLKNNDIFCESNDKP